MGEFVRHSVCPPQRLGSSIASPDPRKTRAAGTKAALCHAEQHRVVPGMGYRRHIHCGVPATDPDARLRELGFALEQTGSIFGSIQSCTLYQPRTSFPRHVNAMKYIGELHKYTLPSKPSRGAGGEQCFLRVTLKIFFF